MNSVSHVKFFLIVVSFQAASASCYAFKTEICLYDHETVSKADKLL